jgi:hypothetical protein
MPKMADIRHREKKKAIIDKFCSLFCTSPFCTSEILIDEFVSRVVALKINKKQHTINVNRIVY